MKVFPMNEVPMKDYLRKPERSIKDIVILSVFGGVAISLFAGISILVNQQYLSPLIFMTGIILIINFQLSLITRDCPLGYSILSIIITLIVNILSAYLVGLCFKSHITNPVIMKTDLFESILTGIIIGFVALVNRNKTIYTIPLTVLLMYAFVYCKLPHCVVYGFNIAQNRVVYGDAPIYNIGMKLLCLVYAVAGNIIGGVLVHIFDKVRESVK